MEQTTQVFKKMKPHKSNINGIESIYGHVEASLIHFN